MFGRRKGALTGQTPFFCLTAVFLLWISDANEV